ncbi:hypothetical protein [Pelagicoccus mobilis]|uniref:Uncharacterized protein n=1 Tax=Pelagicoccus mobilis TaxID=415221 RepID=A0A934S744_9BACT|nr:hypothetical protein [Pelagicoccus mobilis]MBK1880143.1 hypothetical protein [Pelagicoccus mobilis]
MKSSPRQQAKSAYAHFALLCGLILAAFLSSCETAPKPPPPRKVELAPAHYFDAKTGIYFPGALGRLYRKPIVNLENKTPGLGLAITYHSSDARIDVFVFDLQASIIPTGTEPEVIQQSFQSAIEDLEKAARTKPYRNLQIGPQQTARLSSTAFLQSEFQYDESLLAKEGQLLLSGVNSQILKIRAVKTLGSSIDFDRLLGYLGQAIARSQQSGYGGIDNQSYQNISRSLQSIDLSDGLSQAEAIAIAQIELVNRKRHNRYDATSARVIESGLPQFAIVAFAPYPSVNTASSPQSIRVLVRQNGEADLLSIEG